MSAVSADYLNKIKFALRRTASDTLIDADINDIIAECRADLMRVGITEGVAEDESNMLVLGCVKSFSRWRFGIDGIDAERNHEEYLELLDNLRKSQ